MSYPKLLIIRVDPTATLAHFATKNKEWGKKWGKENNNL